MEYWQAAIFWIAFLGAFLHALPELLIADLTPVLLGGLLYLGSGIGLGIARLVRDRNWLHLMEHHAHDHLHEWLAHAHRHAHDEHHQHQHDFAWEADQPHAHWHEHAGVTHKHPHFPDIHHRHEH